MTMDRFSALPDQQGKEEFDRGRVINIPPPKYAHTLTAKRIYDRLVLALQGRGFTIFQEAGFLLTPDVVRQPDVAVVEDWKLKEAAADEYIPGAPLVAIEVASPGNSAEELDIKIDQYLRGGSNAVWVVYPKRKAILRFALVDRRIQSVEYRAGESFSEDSVTPPYEFDLAEFF